MAKILINFPLQRGIKPKHARTFAKHNLIPHLRAFSLFESPQKSSALDAELRLAPLLPTISKMPTAYFTHLVFPSHTIPTQKTKKVKSTHR